MTNKWNYDDALKRALNAKRQAEAEIWAIVGSDPNTESNPYQAELDLGQNNTIYARLYDGLETITVRYDPASNPQLRYWGAAIALSIEDGEYWINGPYKPRLTAQQDGLDLPTDALHLRNHGHTSTSDGGPLGADTVDETNIVTGAVTESKLGTGAVTEDKLGAGAVTEGKLGTGAVTESKLGTGAVTNTKLGSSAITTPKLSLSGGSGINGDLKTLAGGTFAATKYNTTSGVAPTVNDDTTQGYGATSKWYDLSNLKQWVALSAFTASAVWKRYLFSGEVVPTDTSTLTGSSAAIVTQTASDTFSSIDYTFTSNERLLYDGADIRNAYKYYEVTTNALTTSSTTELTMWTSPDMASVIDTTNSTLLVTAMFTVRETTSAPSSYEFYLKYNYDNGGAEAWENIDPTKTPVAITRLHTNTVNYDIPVSLSVPFDPSMTGGVGYTAWGYSGTYKLRFSVARDTGTGTLLIFSGNDFTRTFGIWEQ